MAQIICYEVFPGSRNLNRMRRVLSKRGFNEKENHVGPYFYIEVPKSDSWEINFFLKLRGYKYRSFNKRYERSNKYRKIFFETHHGPYRCAYCGRRIRADEVEVDHCIPVAKAKTGAYARFLLWSMGIANVNSPRNLVASCRRCNRKKSDKMGFWVIRGLLGRFKTFWVIRDIVVILIVIALFGFIVYQTGLWDYLLNLFA